MSTITKCARRLPIPDQVYRDPVQRDTEAHRIICNGKLLPHSWNSRGAAMLGLTIERRRAAAKAAKFGGAS